MKKPRINKNVNHKIYDTLLKIHNNNVKKVNKRYKLTLLRCEMQSLNI